MSIENEQSKNQPVSGSASSDGAAHDNTAGVASENTADNVAQAAETTWNDPAVNDSLAAHEAGWVAPGASAEPSAAPVTAEPATDVPAAAEPAAAAPAAVEPVFVEPVFTEPAVAEPTPSVAAPSEPNPIAEQAAVAYGSAPESSAPAVTASEPTAPAARPNYDPAPAYDPPVALRPTAAYSAPVAEPVVDEPASVAPEAAAVAPASGIPGGEIYPSDTPAAQLAPIYLNTPVEPEKRGNRLGGSMIALLGTVIFAVVYAAVALGFFAFNAGGFESALTVLLNYALTPAFYVPVAAFAIAVILLVIIVNRARWWAYVLGGFLVGVVVYGAALLGAMLTVGAFGFDSAARNEFIRSLLMDPLSLSAAIVAREATVWAGAWISARGRKITAKNAAALEEHNAKLAEAPLTNPAGLPVW